MCLTILLVLLSLISRRGACSNTTVSVNPLNRITPNYETIDPTYTRTELDVARQVAELEQSVDLMSTRVNEVTEHVGYCKMFIDTDTLNRKATFLWNSNIPQGMKDRVGDVIRKNVAIELAIEGGHSAEAELGDVIGGIEILPDY